MSVTVITSELDVLRSAAGIAAVIQPFLKHSPSGDSGMPSLPLQLSIAWPLITIFTSSSALYWIVKPPAPGKSHALGTVKGLV